MLYRKKYRQSIFDLVPDFKSYWKSELNYWSDKEDTANFCEDMTYFSRFIQDYIEEGKELNFIEIFNLIEQFMVDGNQDVKNAVATCFLENLQNAGTSPEKWVSYLGKQSRDYCLAWDEFTGAKTPGL